MKCNTYSDEIEESVIYECQQICNISLVTRRHEISKPTVYSWVRKYKENSLIRTLPKDKEEKFNEIKKTRK